MSAQADHAHSMSQNAAGSTAMSAYGAAAGSRTAEVIVIGAGVVGAAAAYELCRAGVRTVLLERGAPNRESSGTTAGNLHMQAIHPARPAQLVPADFKRFLPLQRAAATLWHTLEEELEADMEVRQVGGFMVAETPEQVAHLQQKWELEQRVGIRSTLLSGAEARSALPLLSQTVLAAGYCGEDGYANPLKVTPAYLAAAQRHGLDLHCFTAVTAIERRGTSYRVRAGNQTWEAPVIVNAGGAWLAQVSQLAGIALQMTPCAIQMHATVRTPPILGHLVQHIGEGLSIKQVPAGTILIGGGWPARSLNLAGRSAASVESICGNLRQAQRILPFLATVRLLRVWAGPLATTPDELPVIGAVAGHPGFIVSGGTYGFTLAPLWGKVLRDLALGQPPCVDLSGLEPDRLRQDAGE